MNPWLDAARQLVERNASLAVRAPDFGPDKTWLNVRRPLSLSGDLAGKVVLVDFWTACSINSLHALPDLEKLEHKYANEPFVVVGCHSAKFAHEAAVAAVRAAVVRHDIAHPIVVDRDFDVWKRYGARSWPTFALVGADGTLLAQLAGEGRFHHLDALISAAIETGRSRGNLDRAPLPVLLERNRELPLELSFPGKLAIDAGARRLYVADSAHHRVLELSLEGRFLRAFGNGEPGLVDGAPSAARFRFPQGLAVDGGELFVADAGNHAVRRIDLGSGAVATLAGSGEPGQERIASLDPRSAALKSPWDVIVHRGAILIAMAGGHQIWRLERDGSLLEPLAGDGSEQVRDGTLRDASFAQPAGLAAIGDVVYVADSESSAIRAIDMGSGAVTTVAGASGEPTDLFHFGDQDGAGRGRRFQHPLGLATDGTRLFVADTFNCKMKALDPKSGEVATIAGLGRPGDADGPAEDAAFNEPSGIAVHGGRVYVADSANHRIRVIDPAAEVVATLTLRDVPLPRFGLARPRRVDELPESPGDPPGVVWRGRVLHRAQLGLLTMRIALHPPEGGGLAEEAPSQFHLRRTHGAIDLEQAKGKIRSTRFDVPLHLDGPGEVDLLLAWYYTGKDGACRLRSSRFVLDLSVGGDGEDSIELSDTAS